MPVANVKLAPDWEKRVFILDFFSFGFRGCYYLVTFAGGFVVKAGVLPRRGFLLQSLKLASY